MELVAGNMQVLPQVFMVVNGHVMKMHDTWLIVIKHDVSRVYDAEITMNMDQCHG
jgi:hypothetical protein